ncbi:MAG: PorV/PorQ family protein [Bacteroidales bacterium]|nr:PorV/PorQ family protein [Bacteroidales bacterium]MCI1785707.1 PorV/PorQ family protein [Bacteroidales bacterium]
MYSNKIVKITALICGMFVFMQFANAQDTKGGDVAMGYSAVVRNPVSAAMGFSGIASSSSMAWSSFSNSAAIPFYNGKFDAQVLYQDWAPTVDAIKSTDIAAGLAFKASDRLGFSLGFVNQSGVSYDLTDENGYSKGSFTPSDIQANIGVGFSLSEKLSAGADLKYLSSKVSDDNSYSAFAADIFAMYRMDDLNLTAGISNFGSSVKDDNGESFDLPASVNFGGAYVVKPGYVQSIEATLDAGYYFSGKFTAACGVQYGLFGTIYLRAGYHYGDDEAVLPSFATAGFGLKLKGVKLDFSYILGNENLKNTMNIGLGIAF